MKIEKINVIVREHLDADPLEIATAAAYGGKPKGSTVGVKIAANGKLYGDYICFAQSTLSASEVADCVNKLFETLLNALEDTK